MSTTMDTDGPKTLLKTVSEKIQQSVTVEGSVTNTTTIDMMEVCDLTYYSIVRKLIIVPRNADKVRESNTCKY